MIIHLEQEDLQGPDIRHPSLELLPRPQSAGFWVWPDGGTTWLGPFADYGTALEAELEFLSKALDPKVLK